MPTEEPIETESPSETLKPTQKPQSDTNEPYMSGYDGKINPDGYMTRAEAATIMVNLSGGLEKESINIFKDVADGTWYKNYIAAASEKGIFPDLKTEHLNRKNLLQENNLLQ